MILRWSFRSLLKCPAIGKRLVQLTEVSLSDFPLNASEVVSCLDVRRSDAEVLEYIRSVHALPREQGPSVPDLAGDHRRRDIQLSRLAECVLGASNLRNSVFSGTKLPPHLLF